MSNISAVGSPGWNFYPYNVGETQFPVAPTAVGDLLVVVAVIGDTHGAHATALSGGGVASWLAVQPALKTTYNSMTMFMGVVETTGQSTVTATIVGSSVVNLYVTQQFTGAPTNWVLDAAGVKTNPASTSILWPTLVPSGPNELYVGFEVSIGTPASTTLTAGYTMPSTGGGLIYNGSVSGSQSPRCSCSPSEPSWAVGALIVAE